MNNFIVFLCVIAITAVSAHHGQRRDHGQHGGPPRHGQGNGHQQWGPPGHGQGNGNRNNNRGVPCIEKIVEAIRAALAANNPSAQSTTSAPSESSTSAAPSESSTSAPAESPSAAP
ncbi:hypothetical protein HA402_001278 [Bradysia odoriphaga]|nr:hypothetical protein HA402_001278 [Bradysia odoriphaga]